MRFDEELLVAEDAVSDDDVDINNILASAKEKQQQVDKRRKIEKILLDKEFKRTYGDPLLEEG